MSYLDSYQKRGIFFQRHKLFYTTHDNEPITFSTQLTKSEESLDKFQSSIKSASEAYTKLLTGNYSSTELLDSIQTINKAATDMGESIDWEEIGSLDELSDKIEGISKPMPKAYFQARESTRKANSDRCLPT